MFFDTTQRNTLLTKKRSVERHKIAMEQFEAPEGTFVQFNKAGQSDEGVPTGMVSIARTLPGGVVPFHLCNPQFGDAPATVTDLVDFTASDDAMHVGKMAGQKYDVEPLTGFWMGVNLGVGTSIKTVRHQNLYPGMYN